jgi:hypothetical protein
MIDIGTEAINYQGPLGPLPRGLKELFQEVLDYKTTLKGTNPEKVRKIHSYCNSTKFMQRFHNLVKQQTGIALKFKFYTTSPMYIFAIAMEVGDELKGPLGDVPYVQYRTEIPEADEINVLLKQAREALNKDTSKITANFASNAVIEAKATLHLCLDTAFCLDLFHEAVTPMTANELTAIILHELGHPISILDYVSQLSQAMTHYTAPVKISKQTPAELAATVKKMKTELNRNKVQSKDLAPHLNVLDRALVQTEELLKEKPNLNLFTTIIVKLWLQLLLTIFWPFTLFMTIHTVLTLWAEDLNDVWISWDTYRTKQSDFKPGRSTYTDMEFRADEYVAAFGMTDSLMLALSRMETNYAILPARNSTSVPYHKRTSLFGYHWSLMVARALAPYMALLECHGTTENRYAKMKRDMLKYMRAPGMPKELEADMLVQYRNVCNIMDAIYLHDKRNKLHRDLLPKLARYILTGNGILKLLLNGKADVDYELLFDYAERMKDNELLYNSKRLERLAK